MSIKKIISRLNGIGPPTQRGSQGTDTAITSQYGYVEYLYHILPFMIILIRVHVFTLY